MAGQRSTEEGKEHYHCLDSLRFVCALAVAVFHAGWVSHARLAPITQNLWVLVDFFFVLSGFVIANAYVDRMHGGRSVTVFAVRRFFRLYPLHVATLAGVGLLQYVGWKRGATAYPFGSNFGFLLFLNLTLSQAVGFSDRSILNVPSWSISTEWYAYLTFALVCLLARRSGFRFALLGLIAFGGLVAMRTFYPDQGLELPAHSSLPRCLMSFGLGTLTFAAYRPLSNRITGTLTGWVALIGMLVACVLMSSVPESALVLFAAPPLFAAIILALALDRGSWVRRALEARWLVYLGERSYSIYINHVGVLIVVSYALGKLPGLKLAAKATSTPTTLALFVGDIALVAFVAILIPISVATYRWIEMPGIEVGRRIVRRLR